MFLCCSLATDFLPTFMYCMGSGNFDVVQTALRNLPEYVLLCQGEKRLLCPFSIAFSNLSKQKSLCFKNHAFAVWRCRVHFVPPLSRTCRHPALQGLFGGHLRTNRHQFDDLRVHEGPSHGSNHLTINCTTPHLYITGLSFAF